MRPFFIMQNMSKGAQFALFVLTMLGVQGCQQSPQPQGKPVEVSSSNHNSGSTTQQASAPQTHLKVGDTAPDFTLTDTNGSPVKLSDFRGKKNVTLAFYVLAFTGG